MLSQILSLVHDERFANLHRAATRDAVPWSTFVDMDMPEGCSPEEAWSILTALRRQTAIVLPFKAYVDDVSAAWYTLTQTMATQLRELEARGRVGSSLDKAISERASHQFLIQPLVEETIAAAKRDGLDVSYEDVREVLRRERRPQNAGEQVMLNCHELLFEMGRYSKRKITRGLIEELYERVLEGAETLEPVYRPRPIEIVDCSYSEPDVALGLICSMADGDVVDPFMHPVITSIGMGCMFWDFHPLPRWNAIVELLLRRIYFVRAGLPVFRYLPISKVSLAWEEGVIRPPEVLCTFAQANPECGEGKDWTYHFSVNLQLMLSALDVLERSVSVVRAREEHLLELLGHDSSINHRQRAILEQALRMPEAEHRIESHRRFCKIAYATARKDFLGLVDLGFMRMEKRDKAFVFKAHPDLKSLIETHEMAPAGR
ncbi:MAG: hypothetical protein AB2L09_01345 [Coriobacteriia bacterium]